MFPHQDRPSSLPGLSPAASGARSPTTPLSPSSSSAALGDSGILSPRSPRRTSSSFPPWASQPTATRRLSIRRNPYSTVTHPPDAPLHTRLLRGAYSLYQQSLRLYLSLSPLYQIVVLIGGLLTFVLGILALIYSHRIFAALGPVAETWRALPGGWLLVWLLTFVCAFPPMIGYSTAVTISGFVYGFPLGWPIVATATVAGSTVAFFTSRGVFSGYVHRLVGRDRRFVALGQVLRRDGVAVLAMIRFCPLPYSLSNGFLATVPSIRPLGFALATACATPKLLVHVFIGSRLALLAESGDKMSAGDRAINYASMFFGGVLGFTVGLVIYRRTMARAAELAATEGLDGDGGEDGLVAGGDRYEDGEDSRLVRGGGVAGASVDMDAAELMDPDDISLWGADDADGYHDSWDEEGTTGGAGGNGAKR